MELVQWSWFTELVHGVGSRSWFLARADTQVCPYGLNNAVTWVFIPTRRSCEGRNHRVNDGVNDRGNQGNRGLPSWIAGAASNRDRTPP